MNITFEGKVALVTGAAGGIGLATARMFAEAGAAVALVDISKAVTERAEELCKAGHRAIGIVCDVADEQQVAQAVERTVGEFGRLDCAYNNVGIHAPRVELADAERSDFDRVMAVNLGGVWNCMKHEFRQMREQGSGAIVNASSQSGLAGLPDMTAYTASKHAVIGLTKCAALEYARRGIRVNCICPGTSDTPMVQQAIREAPKHMEAVIDAIPVGRLGRAEEIASAVLWLCSDFAGFAIGSQVVMDGGYTII